MRLAALGTQHPRPSWGLGKVALSQEGSIGKEKDVGVAQTAKSVSIQAASATAGACESDFNIQYDDEAVSHNHPQGVYTNGQQILAAGCSKSSR